MRCKQTNKRINKHQFTGQNDLRIEIESNVFYRFASDMKLEMHALLTGALLNCTELRNVIQAEST